MYHNKDHWYRYLILNIPSGNSMLGTLWHKGGGLASWIGGGDWADPLSENSFPFDISGTVSSGGGGGVVASIGGCGDVALDALGDLPTWLEEDMTGLHGPTASEAMSTRNLDPGLEVPDPMDARSMALRFRNIKQVSVHFFFLFFCSVVCYFCRERESICYRYRYCWVKKTTSSSSFQRTQFFLLHGWFVIFIFGLKVVWKNLARRWWWCGLGRRKIHLIKSDRRRRRRSRRQKRTRTAKTSFSSRRKVETKEESGVWRGLSRVKPHFWRQKIAPFWSQQNLVKSSPWRSLVW